MEHWTKQNIGGQTLFWAGKKAAGELADICRGRRCFVLADANAYKLHRSALKGIKQIGRLVLRAGEYQKELSAVSKVLAKLHASGASKDSFLVALGGGTVTDIGLCAATVYRGGIGYAAVPSTLLAAAEGCAVSGSYMLDLGSFFDGLSGVGRIDAAVIDSSVLRTQTPELAAGGLGALLRRALAGGELLDYLKENYEKILRSEQDAIERAVLLAARAESFPAGLAAGAVMSRAVLACADYQLTYGEARLLGMHFEHLIAQKITGISSPFRESISDMIFNIFRTRPQLKASYPLLSVLRRDYTGGTDSVPLTLFDAPGKPSVLELSEKELFRAVEELDIDGAEQ